ncbi:hypothetical protein HK101_002686, partial [Irineochytrium annulatum]
MVAYDLVGQAENMYWALDTTYSPMLRFTNDSATNLTTWDAFFPFGASASLLSFEPISADFTGVELIPFIAENAPNYLTDAPRAILLSTLTLIVQEWGYVLAFSGLPPGVLNMSSELNGNGLVMPIATVYEWEPYGPAWNVVAFLFNYMP